MGDSIATGRIGISSKAQHYSAIAAQLTAAQLGIPFRSALHTPDDRGADGCVALTGEGWRVADGGLYGGGTYTVDAGADGALHYRLDDALLTPPCGAVRIGFRGRFDYSVDGGHTWFPQDPGPPDWVSRTEIAVGIDGLLVRARPDAGCRLFWLQRVRPDEPGIAWYTSGIGATRTRDLHRLLSADSEAGYRAYGAVAPDLLTLEIGVNDTIHADVETVRGSRTALQTVLRRLRHYGVNNIAVLGAVPVRADFQPGPWRVADAYREIFRPTAAEAGVPLLDLSLRWGDYGEALKRAYLADQVHPSAAGHADIAAMVSGLLLAGQTGR